MNQAEFEKVFEETTDRLSNILNRKRNDYATEDVLSNFKRMSTLVKILGIDITTPEGYALFMVLMKLDRMCNLLFNEKEAQNESIEDSCIDLMGYTILAKAILDESI